MSRQIQPADPALRTKALAALGGACLLAVAGVLLLDAYFKRLQALAEFDVQLAAEKIRAVGEPILWGVGMGAALVGCWVALTSFRILRAGRSPLPGARVIRDTPVVTGRQAMWRGVIGLALGCVLIFLGLRLPVRASKILDRLLDTQPRPIPVQISGMETYRSTFSVSSRVCSEDGAQPV